jgi:hypothetical protein
MSGRLLSFSQYLGGASNVKVLELFPDDQKTFTYNYGSDVSGYTFTADFQSILLSTLAYDRISGLPNFTDTTVSGYFTNVADIDPATYIDDSTASSGLVKFTIPSSRYTGKVLPNARTNVVCTVVSFQWETGDTPPQKERHRWAILERFDPKVGNNPGDPSLESNFVSLTT